MLNIEDISHFVKEAYELRFISYGKQCLERSYIYTGAIQSMNEANVAVEQNNVEKINTMLKDLEYYVNFYDKQTPDFLKEMEEYIKIYNDPVKNRDLGYGGIIPGSMNHPQYLLDRRDEALNRLKAINRCYQAHLELNLYNEKKDALDNIIRQSDQENKEENLKNIIDEAEKLLTHIKKINHFRKEGLETKYDQFFTKLETEWYKLGFRLAEKGLIDLAVECWLNISPQADLYTKAHFEAFDGVYQAKCNEKGSTPFTAFIDALPACFSEEETLITFPDNMKRIFHSDLLAALGVQASAKEIDSLDQKTMDLLLKYVLLQAARENLKENPEVKLKRKSFFAENREKSLLVSKLEHLPQLPLSLDKLQQIDELINGTKDSKGLWKGIQYSIWPVLFSNESLKAMINAVSEHESLAGDSPKPE